MGLRGGIGRALQWLRGGGPTDAPGPTAQPGPVAGRRATSAPAARRARRIEYSPDLNGRADPGEIVWTWVTYEDDPHLGKDRPVVVVGREDGQLLGLMLSSQSKHAGDRNWLGLGTGPWDSGQRSSWVRLDRVLEIPETGIRREGAVLDRVRFDEIAGRLRSDHGWR
jgi:hypothetical protein